MCYTLSVYPSVPYLSHLLNMLTYHCVNVPFNWRWPAAGMASLQPKYVVREAHYYRMY